MRISTCDPNDVGEKGEKVRGVRGDYQLGFPNSGVLDQNVNTRALDRLGG